MEPEDLVQYSQDSATGPCLEQVQSGPPPSNLIGSSSWIH